MSLENHQQNHQISLQQHQQSNKSIDPNMLNQTNLMETQEIIKNGKKTVHCTCLSTSTVFQINTQLSCSCSTTWTRRLQSGEWNSQQSIQSQDKEYTSEPWKTSLQPLTQHFNHLIWQEMPRGSCMLSDNCQDQQTNMSLNSEYLPYKQALQMSHNSSIYSDKVWTLISQYKLFAEDPIIISKHGLKQQNKEKRLSTWKESIWEERKENTSIEF